MHGILERNFMKVWLSAAGFIGYHMLSDDRAFAIARQQTKPGQLTIIYRRPFCPIGRVERYQNTDKLGQSAKEWELDQADYYKSVSDFRWVLPSPFGNHQIIYAHPRHGPLLGYFSSVWGVVVFPFGKISKP